MLLMMMQGYRDKFSDNNDLGNSNNDDDDDNKTQYCSKYKRKQKL